MLVSFSFDPLPGMSSGEGTDTRTGLYYFDRFGNLELLYRDASISSMYPIPLAPRPRPPVMASTVDPSLGRRGRVPVWRMCGGVSSRLPPDRPHSRIARVPVAAQDRLAHAANEPRIGHANAENARMLLGTVPVEADGSAYFRAPAGKPLYFQAVDAAGPRGAEHAQRDLPATGRTPRLRRLPRSRPAARRTAARRWPCGGRRRGSSPVRTDRTR